MRARPGSSAGCRPTRGSRAGSCRNNSDYDPTTGTFLTPDPVDGTPGTPDEANPYDYVDNDPLNHTDPLGLCRMKDGDFVFEQNRSICEDARANATSTSGCYWGGSELTFYDWDPFNSISYLDGSGCKVNLGDGSIFGEWWTTTYSPCIHVPFTDDDCRSIKASNPTLFKGLVVVAVVAGAVVVVAAGPEIAAYCAAASAVCFSVINGGGGGATVAWRTDTSHIFRQEAGHIATDTPAARQLIESAVQPQYLTRVEQPANIYVYHRLLSNGQEVWAKVRDGVITNGGLNQTPQS